MNITVIFMIGLLVGSTITQFILRPLSIGTLRIDTSISEDNPYMFLELSRSVDAITNQKYVILKVNAKNFIPQK